MNLISVDRALCRKDGLCMEVCPTGYIAADGQGYPVDAAQGMCIECGHCAAICPHLALTHAALPPQDFVPAPRRTLKPEAVENLMKSRRSVREFKDSPIPRKDLEKLLDIARYAPTAVNLQNLSWIVTKDHTSTKRLAASVIAWMRREGVYPHLHQLWDQGRDPVLRGAPHVAVACAPKDARWGAEDSSIALTFMELAAAAMGLGACWAGLLTRAAQAEPSVAMELQLPEGITVYGALMLGIPKYRYCRIPPRKPVRAVWL